MERARYRLIWLAWAFWTSVERYSTGPTPRPGKSEALANVATKFLVGANIGWPPTLRGPGGDNVDNAVMRRAETADEHTKSSVEETFFEKQKWLFAARTSHAPKNG